MTILKEILIAVLSSSVVLTVFVFALKKYLEHLISYEFDKKLKITSIDIRNLGKLKETLLDTHLAIYPEISELVYRLRNIMREGLNKSAAYKWDANLRPLALHLSENLYKYRLFLPEDIFDQLHEFKNITQDALLLVDTMTRQDQIFNKNKYREAIGQFGAKYTRAEELYQSINLLLRQKLKIT